MAVEIYTLNVTCNILWYEFKHDMSLTWYEFNIWQETFCGWINKVDR